MLNFPNIFSAQNKVRIINGFTFPFRPVGLMVCISIPAQTLCIIYFT